MDFHGTASVEDIRGRASVVTFVFRGGIFHVLPRLFPEATEAVGDSLKRFPRPTLLFRWEMEKRNCQESFNWKPEVIHDVLTIKPRKDRLRSLDEISRLLTGEKFCRRASFFTDLAVPSSEALRHRAIRACLVYDFVAEEMKLGE